MADLTYAYVGSDSGTQSAGVAVADLSASALTSAGFSSGDTILIVAGGALGGSASNAVSGKIDLQVNNTNVAYASATTEPRTTSIRGNRPCLFLHRIASWTNTHNIRLYLSGVNGKQGCFGSPFILAIKEDDLDNSDFFYDEHVHSSFNPISYSSCYNEDTADSKGALADGDWVIWGCAQGFAASVDVGVNGALVTDAALPTTVASTPTCTVYSQDSSETLNITHGSMGSFSGDSDGVMVGVSNSSGDFTCTATKILGLRLDIFEEYDKNYAPSVCSTEDAYQTITNCVDLTSSGKKALFVGMASISNGGENRKDHSICIANVTTTETHLDNAVDSGSAILLNHLIWEIDPTTATDNARIRHLVDDNSPAVNRVGAIAQFYNPLAATGPTIIDKTGANALKDSLTVTEPGNQLEYLRQRELADTSELEDFLNRTYSWRKQLADAIADITDTGVCQKVKAQKLLDSINAYDAAVTEYERNRALLDSLDLEDATVLALQWRKALTDDLAVSDAVITLYERFRALIDSLVVEDTAIPTYIEGYEIIERTLADNATLTDALAAARERHRALLDDAELADNYQQRYQRYRALLDALSASDAVVANYLPGAAVIDVTKLDSIGNLVDAFKARRLRWAKLADQIDSLDASIPLRSRERELLDSLAANDAFGRRTAERLRLALDTAEIADAFTHRYLRYRSLSESFAMFDNAIATYVYGAEVVTRELTDSLETADSFVKRYNWSKQLTDTLDLEDAIAALYKWRKQLGDDIDMTQLPARRRIVKEMLDAFWNITDTAVATYISGESVINAEVLTDAVNLLSDTYTQQYMRWRGLLDNANVNDAIKTVRELTLKDQAAINDASLSGRIRRQLLADSLQTSDAVLARREKLTALADTLDLLDSLAPDRHRYRKIAEAILVSELPTLRRIYRRVLETLNVVDTAIPTYIPPDTVIYDKTLSDGFLNIPDNALVLRQFARELLETVITDDAYRASRYRTHELQDSIADLVTTALHYVTRRRILSESLLVSDAIKAGPQTYYRELLDVFDIYDVFEALRLRRRLLIDAPIEITDTARATYLAYIRARVRPILGIRNLFVKGNS